MVGNKISGGETGWEKTLVKTSDNEYELYYEILVGNDMTKKEVVLFFKLIWQLYTIILEEGFGIQMVL